MLLYKLQITNAAVIENREKAMTYPKRSHVLKMMTSLFPLATIMKLCFSQTQIQVKIKNSDYKHKRRPKFKSMLDCLLSFPQVQSKINKKKNIAVPGFPSNAKSYIYSLGSTAYA